MTILNINYENIKVLNQILCAKNAGLPFDYLKRKWVGPYNPRKHLFNESKSGLIPIWFSDEEGDTWRRVGKCYCDWYSIPEQERIKFWIEIASLHSK